MEDDRQIQAATQEQKTYFISYTSCDLAWAIWVEWVIRTQLSPKTIMQEYDFAPGENFRARMDEALKQADIVISILTKDYLKSTNCTDEWTNAKHCIPVKCDDTETTGLLKSAIRISVYNKSRDEAIDALLAELSDQKERPIDEPGFPGKPTTDTAQDEPAFPPSLAESSTRKAPGNHRALNLRERTPSSLAVLSIWRRSRLLLPKVGVLLLLGKAALAKPRLLMSTPTDI